MERRAFIKTSCLACVGTVISGTFLASCSSVKYAVATTLENHVLAIKKADFITLKKGKTSYEKWVLIKTEKLPFPVGVFRFEEDEYSALYLECTHQGCEVTPQGEVLHCPCHGSEFSNIGKVLQSPAETPLKTFEVKTDETNLYIHLK